MHSQKQDTLVESIGIFPFTSVLIPPSAPQIISINSLSQKNKQSNKQKVKENEGHSRVHHLTVFRAKSPSQKQ